MGSEKLNIFMRGMEGGGKDAMAKKRGQIFSHFGEDAHLLDTDPKHVKPFTTVVKMNIAKCTSHKM